MAKTILVLDADGCHGPEGARVYEAHDTVASARRSVGGSRRYRLVATGGPDGTDRVGTRIPSAVLDTLLTSCWTPIASEVRS
jgi:hypothetical protein